METNDCLLPPPPPPSFFPFNFLIPEGNGRFSCRWPELLNDFQMGSAAKSSEHLCVCFGEVWTCEHGAQGKRLWAQTLPVAGASDLGVPGLPHDLIFQRLPCFRRGHLTLCMSSNSVSIFARPVICVKTKFIPQAKLALGSPVCWASH